MILIDFLPPPPALLARVLALRAESKGKPMSSVGPSWHSEKTLLEDPEIGALVWASFESVLTAAARVGLLPAATLQAQAWANVLETGASHRVHAHPGALVSAVYYLSAGSRFVFELAPGGPSTYLKPTAGLLVAFPGELSHYVEPHEEEAFPRVSIALNVRAAPKKGEQ